jgi:hypothetical protein
VPSLGLPKGADAAELARIRTALAQHGKTLFVLSSSATGIEFATDAPKPFSSVATTRWPSTLHTTPSGPLIETVTVYLGTVDEHGQVHELAKAPR